MRNERQPVGNLSAACFGLAVVCTPQVAFAGPVSDGTADPLISSVPAEIMTQSELSEARGALLRGGIVLNLGVNSPSHRTTLIPQLPTVPPIAGVSAGRDAGARLVANVVVPSVLASLAGAHAPVATGAEAAAPLVSGFSAIPVSGR